MATVPHRVRDTMPSRIWAAYEGVRGYEPVIRWADVTTLHELRIGASGCATRSSSCARRSGPTRRPLIEHVVALQDHLGWCTTPTSPPGSRGSSSSTMRTRSATSQSAAIGRYLVDRERERARLRRTIGPAWRGVAGLTFRRQLGRLTAGL